MTKRKRRAGATRAPKWGSQRPPYIGPCCDPLGLWFLEYEHAQGQLARRYAADRAEARAMLAAERQKIVPPGWRTRNR